MTAKEVFLRDKELAGRWSGFINGPDAPRVFAIADAMIINDGEFTQEMIRGARRYRAILETLCDEEEDALPLPKSGLVHDFDPKQHRKLKTKK